MRAAVVVLAAVLGCGDDERLPRADAPVASADGPPPAVADGAPGDAPWPDAAVCEVGFTACNHGFASDFPPVCCDDVTQHCCSVGFEHDDCLPMATACPVLCPRSFEDNCPAGSVCLVDYPQSGVDPGVCATDVTHGCTDTCAPADLCGGECCGANGACVDGCCVPVAG